MKLISLTMFSLIFLFSGTAFGKAKGRKDRRPAQSQETTVIPFNNDSREMVTKFVDGTNGMKTVCYLVKSEGKTEAISCVKLGELPVQPLAQPNAQPQKKNTPDA